MKVSARRAEAFVRSPDPAARAVLLYGPDPGQVRERADRLAAGVVENLGDPFRVAELTGEAVRDDPAVLADEAAALSFGGGRRVVRLRGATDGGAPAIASFLEAPRGDALIVVEAGDLGPRSALRRLFESSGAAAALPCYGDEGRDLAEFIRGVLSEHRLDVQPDAMSYLVERLGGNRQLTRRELEKLVLYAGPGAGSGGAGGGGEVTLADAVACVGDSAALELDDAAFAAADGDFAALDRVMSRLLLEGTSPVALLRAALRHVQRLHLGAGLMRSGASLDSAMQALRPPVFFKQRRRFAAQLGWWPVDRLAEVMERLMQAELDCKQTARPDAAIAERALMAMAIGAARARARPGGGRGAAEPAGATGRRLDN